MIENLIKIMTPPKNPMATGSKSDWAVIENKIGTILPDDYKEYISTYGTGYIGQFLWVLNPFYEKGSTNLMETIEHFNWSYKISKEKFPEDYPREIFPKDDSLLVLGLTDNGDYLFWVYDKSKNPNGWKVGIFDSDYNEEYIYNMNMSTFLEKLVKNEIQTKAFPDDWLQMKNKTFMLP